MENHFPLVSIVTPSFNQGMFIEDTIKSVINQDYPNLEYIIIDGGSSDNTLDIIKKYESKIKIWMSEPDEGQTDAIIKGFKLAKGEYITWLCSDDILEPSAVKIQVGFLKEYPNCGLVYGDRTRIDVKGNIIGYSKYPEFRHFLLKLGYSLPQETVLIRRIIFDKLSGLNKELAMAMDYDLWCQLEKVTEFCHIPRFLGKFRSHPSAKSVNFSAQLMKSGLNGTLTKELPKIRNFHYSGVFPYILYKNLNKILFLLYFIDKRRTAYKEKVVLAENITKN